MLIPIPYKFKIYLEYKADKICIGPLVLVYYGCWIFGDTYILGLDLYTKIMILDQHW
jgi:hypothetical protein